MASLLLSAAGSAIGSSLFDGFTLFGATITGAQIGGAIGTLIGSEIDSALMPGQTVHRTGPRLSDVNIQASTEGAAIPRLFGRMRAAGQLLWATQYKETAVTTSTGEGGKGGTKVTVTETDYKYSISFAVGLCAGVATKIGRVWADGTLIDLTQFTTRFYAGDAAQGFDPLIEEIEGTGNTPAYRGLAYIVFEDMALEQFGNRIPQLQFEVIRSISSADPGSLENALGAVALIPGAGEFVYASEVVTADDGDGTTLVQNAHNSASEADVDASLDELRRELDDVAQAEPLGVLARELACEQRDVGAALAQRRHDQLDNIQPVVQVLAKPPGLDLGGEVAMGRRDHADIDLVDVRRAERLNLALLQRAQ